MESAGCSAFYILWASPPAVTTFIGPIEVQVQEIAGRERKAQTESLKITQDSIWGYKTLVLTFLEQTIQ